MQAQSSPDPMTDMWSWIAYDLRRYRTVHRMSGGKLGDVLGVERGAVSKYETGRVRLPEEHAAVLDEYWDTGGHFTRLCRYAALGHDPDWFKTFTGYEKQATSIRIYEALVVTGLLQTEDYARELLTRARVVDDVEEALEARRQRQAILTKDRPPDVWILLNWPALMQPVGGSAIMRNQLEHLLEMSELPQVSLRIVPREVGAHVGLDGSFSTLESPAMKAGYAEALPKGRLILSSTEVEWYRDKFEQIGSDCQNRTESRNTIREMMREFQ